MIHDFPIVPVVALMIPIVVVPTSLLFKYVERIRRFEHAERIKALEMGRTLPQDEPWWSPPKIAVMIGAGVPIGSLGIALASQETIGYREEVWGISGFVATVSICAGAYLANKHFNHKANMELAAFNASQNNGYGRPLSNAEGKPIVDPDAFDVAGRRG